MPASLVKHVTAPFRRKRCPECGHKVRETYCDVCGYDAGRAEVAGQRAHRQQLASQVLDPGLVLGGLAGEPVGGAHPPVQRCPAGAGSCSGCKPGRVEQRQPGQRVGVDAVALGVPGQEPAQVRCLLRRHPEHPVTAGGKEHRDRHGAGIGPVLALLDDTHAECERIIAAARLEADRITAAAHAETARIGREAAAGPDH